jgi:hypothetical protein
MKEENSYEAWQNSYNTYARQIQHSGIDLDALAYQMLCDVQAAREKVIEPTNKYEYILIGR